MNNTYRILTGHWLDVAKQIPDASVQTCVTSPPYYGLRAYNTEPQIWHENGVARVDPCQLTGHEWQPIKQTKDSWRRGESASSYAQMPGQRSRTPEELKTGRRTYTEVCASCNAWRGELGQEPSPALYIAHLVQCFAEVWRVLRDDGTVWVNLGDAYYNYRPGTHDDARAQGYNRLTSGNARDIPHFTAKRGYKIDGFKEKDLMLIPWRFAIAMCDAGWYVRSEIIWHKRNPLSESVEDRPTKAHEAILMFSKRQDYFYDKWSVTEVPSDNTHPRGRIVKGDLVPHNGKKPLTVESRNNDSFRAATAGTLSLGGRNLRSVWSMNVRGYPEDHFAAFCEELPTRCIKAGSSEVGCCRSCSAPWRRITLKAAKPLRPNETLESRWRRAAAAHGVLDIDKCVTGDSITLGWRRTCKCPYPGPPVPCTVLDLFAGRGTTPSVAVRFGRNAIAVDLQPTYVPMIRKNVSSESPLWVKEQV